MFLKNQWWATVISVLLLLLINLKNSAGAWETPPQPERVFKLNATRHIVPQREPGVVGLDLLIFPMDYPLVQGIFPGTSAAQQGVRAGDRILQINDLSTLGKSRSQIDEMISDRVGERVRLLISREQRLKSVTLTVLPAPTGLKLNH